MSNWRKIKLKEVCSDSIAVFTVSMSAVEKMPSDAVLAIRPLAELK